MARYNFLSRGLKTLVAGAAICTSLLSATAAQAANYDIWKEVQERGTLRCGAAVAAPYVMKDVISGDYSGFFVELCKDFGEKVLNVEVEFVDTSWENLVAGIQSKKWDLGMALNQTPSRALAVAFSTSAMDYQISFVTNAKNPKVNGLGNNLADYDRKDISMAVMSGSAAEKAITKAMKNAKIIRLPGMDEMRLALMSNRADVMVDASDSNHLFALSNEKWAREVFPEPMLANQGVSFGMNRDISYQDKSVLDIYLTELRDTGVVQQLIDDASREVLARQK
ncbi:transporter substrate-binding domain-containing protein [Oceanobacter kriegii]|uniref:transporter substrate-binding domain-containing protein n=1 Tax=Oceanobacter kriegii TaxID=64972 RepID=UPI000401AC99|nr:transporter substrate-binding domain-containing protein [Oceanobacter kriegii]